MTTAQLVRRLSDSDLAVVLHETADEPLASLRLPESGEVVLVVGPEGGIADDELTDLAAAGARVCRLGPHVLRASTAGVAALSALSAAHRWR
jgi:16S rRNA (uracil1498-N3)-methyltransferase